MTVKALVAGNWKMNGTLSSLAEARKIADLVAATPGLTADVLICPPFTLIGAMKQAVPGLAVGAQDCHAKTHGAHTGDISAEMIADLGGSAVIVGHSERRSDHGETSALVKSKAEAALRAGVVAIVCVGETEAQRDAGQTLAIVGEQVAQSLPAGATAANTVIAYEPVWAIGTGRTPTTPEVAEVHAFIRGELEKKLGANGAGVRILYGGSVKPANAAELMAVAHVNGALVGGASLKADDFWGIAGVYL